MPGRAWGQPFTAWALGGRRIRVQRDLPLQTLVGGILVDTNPYTVLLITAVPEDAGWLSEQIADGNIPDDTLEEAADALVQAWVGWERWQARVLWRRAVQQWANIDGHLAANGVDLLDLPADRATNTVYRLLAEWAGNDKKTADEFQHALRTPPPPPRRARRAPPPPRRAESQWSGWQAFAAAAGKSDSLSTT